MPNRDQPLEFPHKGMDVSREFGEQPELTTADCSNVSSRDAIAGRNRGGSRPGFTKYVDAQSTAGAVKIQMLDVIVDPTSAALAQNFETPGDDWVPHPRFPTILIPPKGAPWQPSPNANPALAYQQSTVDGINVTSAEFIVDFPSTIGSGSFQLVAVVTNDAAVGATVIVKNGAGNNYTQVGTYHRFVKLGQQCSLSVWRRRSVDSSASEKSIRVTPNQAVTICIGGMVFTGANASPLGNHVSNVDTVSPMTTTNVAVATTNEGVVGIFAGILSPDTITPGVGFTLAVDHGDGTLDSSDIQLFMEYKLLNAIGNVNPSATYGGGADDFAAVAVCIKD